jgi:indole-3-glycerol phosphate synthase
MSLLDEIIAFKRKQIEVLKKNRSLDEEVLDFNLYKRCSFKQAITRPKGINIIAEIKRVSPSFGVIRIDFNHKKIAKIYEENGAAAISVLTDEGFFGGSINYLLEVKTETKLPILCKDFIIDPYQVYAAKLYGADALLLIAAILSSEELKRLLNLTHKLGLEALVEVHDESDLEKALEIGAGIIGINNRNLKNLKVDLKTCLVLKKKVLDDKILVAESGIKSRENILCLEEAGFAAALIGTILMQAKDIGQKLKELLGR